MLKIMNCHSELTSICSHEVIVLLLNSTMRPPLSPVARYCPEVSNCKLEIMSSKSIKRTLIDEKMNNLHYI